MEEFPSPSFNNGMFLTVAQFLIITRAKICLQRHKSEEGPVFGPRSHPFWFVGFPPQR